MEDISDSISAIMASIMVVLGLQVQSIMEPSMVPVTAGASVGASVAGASVAGATSANMLHVSVLESSSTILTVGKDHLLDASLVRPWLVSD